MPTLERVRPLSPFVRVVFTHRGDCTTCGRINVVAHMSAGRLVCASCTMSGKS